MIYKNGKEIIEIYHGTQPIMDVYRGKRLVWQAVRSCFGKGYWINAKPWINGDGWKNK